VRVLADGDTLTDTLTDAKSETYNLSHAICYSYGTDNKRLMMMMMVVAFPGRSTGSSEIPIPNADEAERRQKASAAGRAQ